MYNYVPLVDEHHPMRPESLQPHTEWSSWFGSELPSVEPDVYVWMALHTPSGACQKRSNSAMYDISRTRLHNLAHNIAMSMWCWYQSTVNSISL